VVKSIVGRLVLAPPGALVGLVVFLCIVGLTFHGLAGSARDWDQMIEASRGVLEGRPHWRAFQNRLMGPALFAALEPVISDPLLRYQAMTLGLLFLHALIFFGMTIAETGETKLALVLLAVWSLLFLGLQDYWLYSWDLVGISFFTAAAGVIVFARDPRLLLLIYPLALLNRETALFIALGYGLARGLPLLAGLREGQRAAQKAMARVALATVALIAAGAAYTKLIRDALFVEKAWDGLDLEHALIGNHFVLPNNLAALLYRNFIEPAHIFPTIAIWAASLYMLRVLLIRAEPNLRAACLLYFAYLGGIVTFGIVNETRLLLPLISLVLFVHVAERLPRQIAVTQSCGQDGR